MFSGSFHFQRMRSQLVAYRVLGSDGSITRSTTPVRELTNSTFCQVFPPSTVLNTPRSSFSVHSAPLAATYTTSGFFGWMTMRPIVYVRVSPICCHVSPASTDLYTPVPAAPVRKMFASPVPTHTTSGLDGATVTSPIVADAACSKMGVQLMPSLLVFHTPP